MFETMAQFLTYILLFLDSIVYSLISWVYQIILLLCQIDILDNSTEVEALMNRIYVIVGVVVMFLMAYSLLKSMVNPNIDMKDKKSPVNIIKDVIISIVLIALVPSIFSFASDFQRAILMENTIGKIVLGTSSETTGESSSQTIEEGGVEIASNILQAFLHPVYSQCTQRDDYTYDCSEVEVATQNLISWIPVVGLFLSIDGGYSNYDAIWEEIKDTGNFLNITIFAYSLSHESTVTYYYIISTAVGVFVLLVLLSYCIDIAIRTVKLAVYQLLAPLPILSRILPGEQGRKVFDNWLRATISTYVEVFIRLAILFFAVLLIKIVVQNLPTLLFADALISGEASFTVYLFAQLFIIVGIILFVKQAPGIIKEITGLDGGKYNVFGSAMRTLSTIGGGVTAAARNFNAVYDNGENQSKLDRAKSFASGLRSAAAGLGSGAFRATWNREGVKNLHDVRDNAHRAADEAIKKRIQRENQKQDKEEYIRALNEERRIIHNEEPLKGVKAWGAYKAYRAKTAATEWAGAGQYDEVAVSRTKDYADAIDRNFSVLENTWKKSQAFIDAKAEAENLDDDRRLFHQRLQEEMANIYRVQGIDPARATDSDRRAIEDLANQELVRKYGKSFAEVNEAYTQAKNRQEGRKRAEQLKKAETIASAARSIQLANSQFSDVRVNIDDVIGRWNNDYNDPNLSADAKRAIKDRFESIMSRYNNLSNDAVYNRLVSDIKAGIGSDENNAAMEYLEILDKMNIQARVNKDAAANIEQERKGTFTKAPKDGGNK